ncbi:unnamed protein product [Lathyrus sativus]|nr:unnamed protein product [Lathyrus sativus]
MKNEKISKVWKPVTKKLNIVHQEDNSQVPREEEKASEVSEGKTPEPVKPSEDWTIVTSRKVDKGNKDMSHTPNNSFMKYQNLFTPLRIGDYPRGDNNLDQ